MIDPVWALLSSAYARHGVRPTLLERDFNFPPLATLLDEVARIRDVQAATANMLERAERTWVDKAPTVEQRWSDHSPLLVEYR